MPRDVSHRITYGTSCSPDAVAAVPAMPPVLIVCVFKGTAAPFTAVPFTFDSGAFAGCCTPVVVAISFIIAVSAATCDCNDCTACVSSSCEGCFSAAKGLIARRRVVHRECVLLKQDTKAVDGAINAIEATKARGAARGAM
eukprot:8644-Heterococcus_DN1.PRE.2